MQTLSGGESGRRCELYLALTGTRDTHYDRGTYESMEAASVALTDVDGKAVLHLDITTGSVLQNKVLT